jgi:hypothetical protein
MWLNWPGSCCGKPPAAPNDPPNSPHSTHSATSGVAARHEAPVAVGCGLFDAVRLARARHGLLAHRHHRLDPVGSICAANGRFWACSHPHFSQASSAACSAPAAADITTDRVDGGGDEIRVRRGVPVGSPYWRWFFSSPTKASARGGRGVSHTTPRPLPLAGASQACRSSLCAKSDSP